MEYTISDKELAQSLIYYDPLSGIAIWLYRRLEFFKDEAHWKMWNTRFAGRQAGTIYTLPKTGKKYFRVLFRGKRIGLHRLIWLMQTGEWPNLIDHRDGNGLNNAWVNLTDTDYIGNARNCRRSKDRVLPTGVRLQGKRFRADIRANGMAIYLGTFDTVSEAGEARKIMERRLGFSSNHGEVRPR